MAGRWRLGALSGIALGAALTLTGGMAAPATVASAISDLAGSSVPADAASTVAGGGGFLKEEWGDDDTGEDEKASKATGQWQAGYDQGSLYSIAQASGVYDAWFRTDPSGRAITGKDVTVAVIDTGVAPVGGLSGAGKVINGPDLSFESQAPGTRYVDGYGHGTHLAAIIAGRDIGYTAGAKYFVGIAPDARILNMKVATADGGTDVTQVITAIDWIVQHRADNGMNVRVINLVGVAVASLPAATTTTMPLRQAFSTARARGSTR